MTIRELLKVLRGLKKDARICVCNVCDGEGEKLKDIDVVLWLSDFDTGKEFYSIYPKNNGCG